MVKTRSAPSIQRGSASRRTSDLWGLALFFLGATLLIWLTWPQREAVPSALENALRLLAGSGAYAIPVILMFAGSMFLLGYSRITFSHSSLGSILLFLAFVTWRHLAAPVPHAPVADLPSVAGSLHGAQPADPAWIESRLVAAGGYSGAVVGTVLVNVLGRPGAWMLLLFQTCAGIVLIVERPFLELLHSVFGKPAAAGYGAAKQGVAAVRERRSLNGGDRAARVAERAIAPPADDGETVLRRRGLFPFRGARDGAVDDGDSARAGMPADPHPAIEGPATAPVKVNGGIARPRKGSPAEQTAFPTLDLETGGDDGFKLPPIALLKETPPAPKRSTQELADRIKVLEQTLEDFKIQANVVEVAHGPAVTRYEIQLAPGIKVSKIVSLADNLAMSLAAIDVRVEAPIPGKSAIGVEVPNAAPAAVSLRECIDSPEFWNAPSKLTFALGKDVGGQTRYADLTKMPHLLVAGSTNSGKSVCLNALIASMLYRATPAELKFLMIDPKRVELSLWDGIPHLMHPVVKDVKQAAGLFRAALKEMERRYDLFARMQTRNIDGYNQRVQPDDKLPYIVVVVDELADLMMQAAAEVETSICRLAQLARATGIHLVIATQRPSVDVITGLIKANISSRIAFAVSSSVDSRTILDMNGAERLIGRGDMLFMPIDASKPMRIQGCYLSENETNTLVKYLKEQEPPTYSLSVEEVDAGRNEPGGYVDGDEDDDALFEKAVRLVVTNGHCSTSMLQRRFKIGYTRAARIVDLMEERRIVGPPDGAKPREVTISRDEADMLFRTGRYGIPEELLE